VNPDELTIRIYFLPSGNLLLPLVKNQAIS
jgi:hypothetical protein